VSVSGVKVPASEAAWLRLLSVLIATTKLSSVSMMCVCGCSHATYEVELWVTGCVCFSGSPYSLEESAVTTAEVLNKPFTSGLLMFKAKFCFANEHAVETK